MIESGLILTGNDADVLKRALSGVKTRVYEESETSLDDTQALDALLSSFRTAETGEREKETRHAYISPLRKRLTLGTIIGTRRRGQSRGLNSSSPNVEWGWQARAVLATLINRKVPLNLSSTPLSGPCALVFPQPPHANKARLVASP